MTALHATGVGRLALGNDRNGYEERFLPTRLSAGGGFRKETIAGTRRNGREAPIPDLPALDPEREGSVRISDAGPTRAIDPV